MADDQLVPSKPMGSGASVGQLKALPLDDNTAVCLANAAGVTNPTIGSKYGAEFVAGTNPDGQRFGSTLVRGSESEDARVSGPNGTITVGKDGKPSADPAPFAKNQSALKDSLAKGASRCLAKPGV